MALSVYIPRLSESMIGGRRMSQATYSPKQAVAACFIHRPQGGQTSAAGRPFRVPAELEPHGGQDLGREVVLAA